MREELISIIVPVYNVETYIEKCVDSLLGQTYKNLQIILIEGGSTDGSATVCDRMLQKDSRVQVIHMENRGVSASRNAGLDIAKGVYIGFVDSDDYVESDYIETLASGIDGADMSICGFYEDMPSEIITRTSGDVQELNQQEAMKNLLLENTYRGFLWNKLFLADIVQGKNIRFDESISVWEDVLFDFKYLLYCKGASYNPTPKYHYVWRQGSAAHGDRAIYKAYSVIEAQRQIETLISDGYESVESQLRVRYITSALAVLRMCALDPTDTREYESKAVALIKENKGYCDHRLTKQDRLSAKLVLIHPGLFRIIYRMKHQ